MEEENEKIEYEDLLCPKCSSDEFDYIDESNFLDNPSVVYFECKSCGCSFSALRHIQYSKVSEEEENEEVKVLNEIEEKKKKGLPLTNVEQEIISSSAFK